MCAECRVPRSSCMQRLRRRPALAPPAWRRQSGAAHSCGTFASVWCPIEPVQPCRESIEVMSAWEGPLWVPARLVARVPQPGCVSCWCPEKPSSHSALPHDISHDRRLALMLSMATLGHVAQARLDRPQVAGIAAGDARSVRRPDVAAPQRHAGQPRTVVASIVFSTDVAPVCGGRSCPLWATSRR